MTARPAWAQPAAPRRRRALIDDPLNPLESVEQRRVADYLRARGDLLWTHVPNESKRGPRQGRALKEAGMQKGVPDILIFTPMTVMAAPRAMLHVGLALELKRRKGAGATAEQLVWRECLKECGWRWQLCRGADEAVKVVEECYGAPCAARRVT